LVTEHLPVPLVTGSLVSPRRLAPVCGYTALMAHLQIDPFAGLSGVLAVCAVLAVIAIASAR
jgi:hypothetical protein